MNTWIHGTGILLMLSAVAVLNPGYAAAQPPKPVDSDAVLYELSENLSLRALKQGQRKAKAQLLGLAKGGTPLCPASLGAPYCTINATGSDDIDVKTGLGTFGGTFTVVVTCVGNYCDNPADSPEVVVARGRFSGEMNFAPALIQGVPYGTVVGEVGLNGSRPSPFTGIFRLPVAWGDQSVYLGTNGWEPVAGNEHALGYPTVRFEISFPSSN